MGDDYIIIEGSCEGIKFLQNFGRVIFQNEDGEEFKKVTEVSYVKLKENLSFSDDVLVVRSFEEEVAKNFIDRRLYICRQGLDYLGVSVFMASGFFSEIVAVPFTMEDTPYYFVDKNNGKYTISGPETRNLQGYQWNAENYTFFSSYTEAERCCEIRNFIENLAIKNNQLEGAPLILHCIIYNREKDDIDVVSICNDYLPGSNCFTSENIDKIFERYNDYEIRLYYLGIPE